MKYKPGDRVKIREDLNEDMENVVEKMVSFAGEKVTIVTSDEYCYGIKEDQSGCWPGWDWQDHMIECRVEDAISEDEKEKFWEVNSDIMEPDAQPEKIHHPQHYSARNGYECIDIIRIMTKGIDGYEGYLIGNVIKYIFRYNEKNGVEDLKKSIKYLEFLIKEMEKNG